MNTKSIITPQDPFEIVDEYNGCMYCGDPIKDDYRGCCGEVHECKWYHLANGEVYNEDEYADFLMKHDKG